MNRLKVLDLFSGIGGFSLGLEATGGFETVGFVEWEEFPRKVLTKHWPGVPIMGDIREVKGDEFGPIDVITGGFPCQPFSNAGKRTGQADNRFLWPEMRRVIEKAKPAWVIGENVPGIIRLALDDVLSDLEAIGYTCWPVVIPACAVNAPHRRDRVWIIANRQSHGTQGRICKQDRGTFAGAHGNTPDVANASGAGCEKRDLPTIAGGKGFCSGRHDAGTGKGRLESGLGGMADGLSGWLDEPVPRTTTIKTDRAKRLKGLGNAVVPQVVYQIGMMILQVHYGGHEKGAS